MEKRIWHWYTNGSLPKELGSLTAGQLEVLCYEYMRDQNLISRLTCPIGRGLRDIDIVGLNSKGENVFAQVTFATDEVTINKKAERLRGVSGECQAYLFSPKGESPIQDVVPVRIQDVFDRADDQLISAMIQPVTPR